MNIKTLFLLISLFFITSPILAEEIQNYETSITINTDASISVQEKILYDFGFLQRHGIYRDIPYKYNARGGTFTIQISDVSVLDETGNKYIFTTSTQNNDFKIKIGDPDSYISGQKTYIINYKVKKAINYFSEHDELYWNAIGGNWLIDINKSLIKINVPQSSDITYACYYGQIKSTTTCPINKEGNQLTIEHNDVLYPGNYLTIVVGLPKGILYKPSTIENIWYTIIDNLIIFLPFIVFIFLLIKWFKHGRDPKGKGIIVPQYEPLKDLSPLESITLINERFEIKNIPAEIINLAIKGYVKIKKLEKTSFFNKQDYFLIKIKDIDDSLNDGEKLLLSKLFLINESILLSTVKSDDIEGLKYETKKSLTQKGYFEKNPLKTKTTYIIIGFLILSSLVFVKHSTITIVSIFATSLIVFFFGMIMPKKTVKGVEAKEYLLGLKKYISLAEIRRIQFHNAPAKTPEHFEKLLPYAMIFNLEKKWAEEFNSLKYSPTWYEDRNLTTFSSVIFVDNLNTFYTTGKNSIASSPNGGSGFGGGGFSGGGFGGGGGGSW